MSVGPAGIVAPDATGEPPATHEPGHPRRRSRVVTRVALIVVLAIAAAVGLAMARAATGSGDDHAYEIPPGARARIAAGEQVTIIPVELHLATDDRLTITNHDSAVHSIGLFSVRPGETVSYQFAGPGVFRGACTVHPTGSVTIYVE